jgi:hypothetical protein
VTENKTRSFQFFNKKQKHEDFITLELGKEESIVKVKFGYNLLGATAVKIVTDYQKKRLGDMKSAEFKSESISQNDTGIVGFEFVFDSNRLVEAEVFLAPILMKSRTIKRKASLAPFNDAASHNVKLSASIALVRHVFKAYKNLKMNSSF